MIETQTEAPNLEDAGLADAARSETGLVNPPTAGLEFRVPLGGNRESGLGGRGQGSAALDFYPARKTGCVLPLQA